MSMTTTTQQTLTYTGRDNLEVMEVAQNYSRYLVEQVWANAPSDPAAAAAGMRVVDFGAGSGYFAELCSRRPEAGSGSGPEAAGFKVACIEPDAAMRAEIRARGIEAFENTSELADASVDYCYSLNVLEHIEDDVAALREIHRILKPGARAYFYVPAFQILYSSMDRKVGHVRRYTRASLARAAVAAGFRVEADRYCDSLGYPVSLLYKWFGNDRGDINPATIRLYDRVIFPVSSALDWVVGRWFGKNASAVFVKGLG